MQTLNRSALVLALLGAGCLSPAFAQETGTLEIAAEPTLSETTTSTDPLANLSAEERESLLTKASIEAGYGEPYPADNPEAMAVIYDLAAQMLAASDAVAKEEILPVDGEVIIKETGEIVPTEEVLYTLTSVDSPTSGEMVKRTNNGSVGGDVDIKNRFGQTVRSLASALKMYESDTRRAGIGRALSHEVQTLLAAIKMYDADMGRLASNTSDPVKGTGIGGFDAAMISNNSALELLIDIRETTTGTNVEYRLYGPGHAHWGSASFASAPGGSKELQAWFMEVVSGKNIRKNITVSAAPQDTPHADARSGSASAKEVIELIVDHARYDRVSGGGVTFDKREVTGGERTGTVRNYTITKVNWANIVLEAADGSGPETAPKIQQISKFKLDFKGGNGATPTLRSVSGEGILIPQVDYTAGPDQHEQKRPGQVYFSDLTLQGPMTQERKALATWMNSTRVVELLTALAAQTGNETLLLVAQAVAQERIKLRQNRAMENSTPALLAHEAAHTVQQRTSNDEVWNQPLRLVTETTIPALQEGKKGLNAVNVKLAKVAPPGGGSAGTSGAEFLQQAINTQSQTFNTLTNVQKSKHDAAMAAIQNTR